MTSPLSRGMSEPVASLLFQLRAVGLDEGVVTEHRFHPSRMFRFDLAVPSKMVAAEIDGGSWIGGRHTSGTGFENDCIKLSWAAALGWRVFRFTPRMVKDGLALDLLEGALR